MMPEKPLEPGDTVEIHHRGKCRAAVQMGRVYAHRLTDAERTSERTAGDFLAPPYEVRTHMSVMGTMNMGESELDAIGWNPFHPDFEDNELRGRGETIAAALVALDASREDMLGGFHA